MKSHKIQISIVLIMCLIGAYFFVFKQDSVVKNEIKNEDTSSSIKNISISNTSLNLASSTEVTSMNLRPDFHVGFDKGFILSAIRIDGLDVLGNVSFLRKKKLEDTSFEFTPSFLIKPGNHKIVVAGNNPFGYKELEAEFKIILSEDFSGASSSPDLFALPEDTLKEYSKSWYVKDGVLKVDKLGGNSHASLAFVYPLGDIDVSFEFTPQGKNIDFAFYFYEQQRTLVLGNGNDKKITLLRGNTKSIAGDDFQFKPGEKYRAKISYKSGKYDLYIKKINDLEWSHPLSFQEESYLKQDSYVGFTVWKNTDGVEIDNLSIQ